MELERTTRRPAEHTAGAAASTVARTPRKAVRVQAKLVVGAVDDPQEREADRVADEVLRELADPSGDDATLEPPSESGRVARGAAVRRTVARSPVAAPRVLRRLPTAAAGPEGGDLDPETAGRIRSAGGGEPLAPSVRAPMERAFRADFGDVRVHRSSALAPELGAVAFTSGRDIHFAPDRYRPDDREGQRLLGHELAHVVQQTGAAPPPVRRKEDATLIGHKTAGEAPLSIKDSYAFRYVYRALKPSEVKGIIKDVLTAQLAQSVTNTKTDANYPFPITDPEAQQVLTAYKGHVDRLPHEESWNVMDATWKDATLNAVPGRYTLINHLFAALKSEFLTEARKRYKRLDGEIEMREKNMKAEVGTGPDGPTKAQWATALRSLPGLKELIAAVKSGGPKTKAPVIGFQEQGWKDGGKVVDKIVKKPGGVDDSPVADTPQELKLMKDKVQKADDFYRALVEPSVLATIPRPIINYHLIKAFDVVGAQLDGNGKKSYTANQDGPAVNVGQGVFPHIIVHEIGHYIEDNLPRDDWAAIALLLKARHGVAGGGNLVAGPGGARQKGDYPATGEYTSRAYATGTEVSSMTLEELSQSGKLDAMIDNDPQQVAIVIRTLRPNSYRDHRPLRAFDKFLP